jgi:hypothetical protein
MQVAKDCSSYRRLLNVASGWWFADESDVVYLVFE